MSHLGALKVLQFKDLKSEKLKEICLSIRAQNKPNVLPHFMWIKDWDEPSYYHYSIAVYHYSVPCPFPTSQPPICYSDWETIIIDNETNEHLEIAVKTNVLDRLKASKRNQKIHFQFSEGHAEITDIGKVVCWRTTNDKHLTLFTYMKPT